MIETGTAGANSTVIQPSKQSFHASQFKMAAAAGLNFDSDDSGADWEGFEEDDLPLAAYLDRNDVPVSRDLSDIEVSSVNSTDLSDLGAVSDAGSADEGEPDNIGDGPNHAANGGGRWTVDLTALAKAAFSGPNPGPTEVLDATALELDFFFKFFPQDLIEVYKQRGRIGK